ncbi:MAG: twin-arginine translocase TatA/TatE family subunit [Propionibacteriaceae bacterium]
MTPLITPLIGIGPPELLIILAIVLLLFGGSRLAGLGKSSGKALREFKEETNSLRSNDKGEDSKEVAPGDSAQPTADKVEEPVEAEVVEDPATRRHDA